MIPVEEARQRLLATLTALGTEQIPVGDGLGRILAEDLAARRTQPPAPLSAMDGYAVRAADVVQIPARLRVIGEVPAGKSYDKQLGAGEAIRIFTGAPLPGGSDAIVIQEDTDRAGDIVVVKEASAVGRHVRAAGLDFREGEIMLKAGRRLTARDVGLAAAMNRPWLRVHRRPRVAILPTGDEIVLPGDPVGPNQIVSSNSFALGALVQACGGIPVALPIAPDEAGALQDIAGTATGIDLLVTTGGASVGDHDLIRGALGETGLVLDFWQIAMRPGKPLMVGKFRGTPMIGLPGNPVSTMVCSMLFLKPAIEKLSGLEPKEPALQKVRLGAPLKENDRRQDYLRASLSRLADGTLETKPFTKQDSSMMSLLAAADCLIVRAPHAPAAMAGDSVDIMLLAGDPAPL